MLAAASMAGAAAHAASEEAPTTPPPPTNVHLYLYSGSLIGVAWTNGDTTSSTDIGFNASGADPTSVTDNMPNKTEFYGTGTEDEEFWFVRHNAGGGEVSAWVIAEPVEA